MKTEITKKLNQLRLQIEQCGASVALTEASILAGELARLVEALPDAPAVESTPVAETKSWRAEIKTLLERMDASGRKSRSRSLAVTKLEEASMCLQEQREANPYPNSFNPESPVIDASAPEAAALTIP